MAHDELDLLAPPPDWRPDANAARLRFEERVRRSRASRRMLMPAAALAAVAVAIAVVSTDIRLAAHQMWHWITVGRIEVVRVNFDDLPNEARSLFAQQLNDVEPPQPVSTVAEATSIAGFEPRLPRAGIVPGEPKLSVMGPMVHGTVIKVADVELALRKAGVTDQPVPRSWDGAKLEFRIGRSIFAEWPEMMLIQALRPSYSVSPGLDLGEFGAVMLRALGMPRNAAERFGRRMRETPSMLCGVGIDDNAAVSEVKLRHGYGTLIENFGEDGRLERVELLWGAGDRLYALSGAASIATATSIANATE